MCPRKYFNIKIQLLISQLLKKKVFVIYIPGVYLKSVTYRIQYIFSYLLILEKIQNSEFKNA